MRNIFWTYAQGWADGWFNGFFHGGIVSLFSLAIVVSSARDKLKEAYNRGPNKQ